MNALWQPVLDKIAQGGWLMLPILMTGFVMWVLVLRKWLDISASLHGVRRYRGCASEESVLPEDHWLASFSRNYRELRSGNEEVDGRLADALVGRLHGDIVRGVSTVRIMATVAPLLGLLGTVVGMIVSFEGLALHGVGDARNVAGGMAQALVTTQTGLLFGVPGVIAGNILRRRARRLRQRMEVCAVQLEKRITEEGGAA